LSKTRLWKWSSLPLFFTAPKAFRTWFNSLHVRSHKQQRLEGWSYGKEGEYQCWAK
jgi:hypothetical protein